MSNELAFSQFSYNAQSLLQSGDCCLKTNHSECKVCFSPWVVLYLHCTPSAFYETSVQCFGNSVWSVFVFNSLMNSSFSARFVITWHVPFLGHFWICWTGHIPVEIPKGLFCDLLLLQNLLPATWLFEYLYPTEG